MPKKNIVGSWNTSKLVSENVVLAMLLVILVRKSASIGSVRLIGNLAEEETWGLLYFVWLRRFLVCLSTSLNVLHSYRCPKGR